MLLVWGHDLQADRQVLVNVLSIDRFADDMLIFTANWQDHMTSLDHVLD